jgi:hypothetical protein
MHYPLVSGETLVHLRWAHGIYNLCVLLLCFYLGWLGFRIRRSRLARKPPPFFAIKRHRKRGPVLAALGVFGFFTGLVLILVHTGRIFDYPNHLVAGLSIAVLLLWTLVLSRKIKGIDPSYRNLHAIIGISILLLFFAEMVLGIRILLGIA